MTAEAKLRQLAIASTTLQADLGYPVFRWFDRRLPQQYLQPGQTCMRVTRVSSAFDYNQGGVNNLQQIRFQFDVIDFAAEIARAVAIDLIAFLATVDLTSSVQFTSPIGTPNHAPCFLLNQRSGMIADLEAPAYVETLDYRIYNRSDLP